MFVVPGNNEQLTSLQVGTCSVDLGKAMTVDAHHEVVLPGTLCSVSIVVAGTRKPAYVRGVDRADQRVALRTRKDWPRDYVHVLAREAVS